MQQLTPSYIADAIKPYVVKWIQEAQLRESANQVQLGVTAIHDIGGSLHNGTLRSDQAPQFLSRDGTRSLTGNLSVDSGVTIDGVDISAHAADPNAHHAQVHDLISGNHTASGLTAGHVVRASSVTTFAFSQLQHTDLGGVTADQHHAKQHGITDAANHTVTGAQWQLVGLTGTNALGLLTPSSSPAAAAAILRTDTVGSFAFDTNLLVIDAPNNRIGINRTPGAAALDVLAAANADHTLRVQQKSGQTGRLWRVEDTGGNELIVLDSVGNLQSGSPGFVSGLTGWQITPQGNAEFNNAWIRGELHSSIFVMDEFHATGGTMMIATAGKLENDAVMDSTTGDESLTSIRTTSGTGSGTVLDIRTTSGTGSGTQLTARSIENWIELTDPPSGHATTFQPGDIVRTKFFTGTSVLDWWLRINSHTDMTDYWRYHVEKMSGTDGTAPAGTGVVSYGVRGDGRILLTSDLNYAPYIDIFSRGGDAPWTGSAGEIIPHARFGRLDGLGVPGLSGIEQYGIAAGTDLSNANSPYFYATNLGVKLYQIPLTLNDGSNDTVTLESGGRVRFGTNVAAAATTGFDFDPVTGNLTIGNASYPGTVSIYGSVTITNSIPVGSVSGLGSLATASDVAWGSQVTGRPTELTDGRITAGLNSSGYVITKVLPGTAVGTPAGSGLYLGSDKLGYYSGSAWTLYFDNTGKMGLGGTSGARLGWDGTDLFGTDGTNVQWYARASTGKLMAGGGLTELSRNGLALQAPGGSTENQITWYEDITTKTYLAATIGAYTDPYAHVIKLAGRGGNSMPGEAWLVGKTAADAVSSYVRAKGDGNVIISGTVTNESLLNIRSTA